MSENYSTRDLSPEEEIKLINAEKHEIRMRLEELNKRLSELFDIMTKKQVKEN